MRIFVLAVVGACSLLVNCGSTPDPTPPFSDNGGSGGGTAHGGNAGSGGTSAATACQTYCDAITTDGTDCSAYNASGRCKINCINYTTGPCPTEWAAFQQCILQSSKITCMVPDAGNTTLLTVGCQTEYDAWNNCQKEHDAGCPQGT